MNTHYEKYKESIKNATRKFYHKQKSELKYLKQFELNVKQILEKIEMTDEQKIFNIKQLINDSGTKEEHS
jgi:hypothetical protein